MVFCDKIALGVGIEWKPRLLHALSMRCAMGCSAVLEYGNSLVDRGSKNGWSITFPDTPTIFSTFV